MIKNILSIILLLVATIAQAQYATPSSNGFAVQGEVNRKILLRIEDLKKMHAVEIGDYEVRSHTGELKFTATEMKGVLLKKILDSAGVKELLPRDLSSYYYVFTAADGYKVVFSWNEIYNTDIGKQLFVVTSMQGKDITNMSQSILIVSLGDENGRRFMKGLATIDVKKAK